MIIRRIGVLFEFLSETFPEALAKGWLEAYMRLRYPEKQRRSEIITRRYIRLHSTFYHKIQNVLPWGWLLVFTAIIGLMIVVVLM